MQSKIHCHAYRLGMPITNQVRLCKPNRARGEAALFNWPAPMELKDVFGSQQPPHSQVCLQTPNWEGQFQSQITHLATTLSGCLVVHANNV